MVIEGSKIDYKANEKELIVTWQNPPTLSCHALYIQKH